MFNFPQNTQPNSLGMINNNVLQYQNAINEQFYSNSIKEYMSFIFQCQVSPDIGYVVPFLIKQQRDVIQQFNNCSACQGITEYDEQYLKLVRERCLKLKSNNQILLIEMLNIKQRFSRILSLNIDKSPQQEQQFNIVHDKIRRIKMDIVNKLRNLKTNRLFDQNLNKNKMNSQSKGKFAPINIALTELKDATENIDRELIKQREEIRMLIKTLYDENI